MKAERTEFGGGDMIIKAMLAATPYVDKIVKKMMRRAGLDPKGYGAHSLRAGFVTQAALLGKTESEIMRHTGHGNNAMVRRYIRVAELHKYNATRGIGL